MFALTEGIAGPEHSSPFESRGQFAELQPASDTGIFLVANIVTNPGADNGITAPAPAEGSFGEGGFSSVAPFVIAVFDQMDGAAAGAARNLVSVQSNRGASPLNLHILGVDEGIDNIRRQIRELRGTQGAGPPAPEFNDDGPQSALDFHAPAGTAHAPATRCWQVVPAAMFQGSPDAAEGLQPWERADPRRQPIADGPPEGRPLAVVLLEAEGATVDVPAWQDRLPLVCLSLLVLERSDRLRKTPMPRTTSSS